MWPNPCTSLWLARCPHLLTSSDWRHRPTSTQPALKAAHMKATSHAPKSLRYDSQNNKGGKFMMGYQASNEIWHIDNIFGRLGQSRPMAGKGCPSLPNLQFFLTFFRRAFQRPVLIFQKPYPSTRSAPWMQVRPWWRVLWLWSSLAFHVASHPHRHPPLLQKPAKDYFNSYLYDIMQSSNPRCTWRWAASTTGHAPSCAAAWPCTYCVRIPSARLRNQKAGIK